jgi:hypothetical protein
MPIRPRRFADFVSVLRTDRHHDREASINANPTAHLPPPEQGLRLRHGVVISGAMHSDKLGDPSQRLPLRLRGTALHRLLT